jgi:chromosome segregation ATPase
MAFSASEIQDLVRVLEQHPDWRRELRRVLLSDDVVDLPRLMGELAEAQRATEARLERLTERVDQLAEAQRATEARLERLTERVDQLAEAQRATEVRLERLTERVDQLTQRVDQLTQRHDQLTQRLDQLTQRLDQLTQRVDQLAAAQQEIASQLAQLTRTVDQLAKQMHLLTNQVGRLKGSDLERRYRERAPAYFAPLLRRIHALSSEEIAALLDDAEERGLIAETEREELLAADVVVRGVSRRDDAEAYLAVEVSGGIGEDDVKRAARRAELLRKLTGKPALAVVAGEAITDEGERAAQRLRAWQVLDGQCVAPPS